MTDAAGVGWLSVRPNSMASAKSFSPSSSLKPGLKLPLMALGNLFKK
jgi:hypothetical protein